MYWGECEWPAVSATLEPTTPDLSRVFQNVTGLSHCKFKLRFDFRRVQQWERTTGSQGSTPRPLLDRASEGSFVCC